MAFTGTAVVERISANRARITGLSLGIGAAGTIAMAAGSGEVEITAPEWQPQGSVNMADAARVSVTLVSGATVAPAVGVVKTGTVASDFLATLTNLGAAATGTLEIWVDFLN